MPTNTTFNTVTVTTAATKIVASTGVRKGLIISNFDQAKTLYVGPTSAITTANAIPIYSRGTLIMSGVTEAWMSDVFGITESGTIDARFWSWGQ